MSLHVFADEPQLAVGVVIHLRAYHEEYIQVCFLMGNCRVASIRASTISKLRLQVAVIGQRFPCNVKQFLPSNPVQIFQRSEGSTALPSIILVHTRLCFCCGDGG